MADEENVASEPQGTPPQFGLTALLWTTFVIGLALAYLRTIDEPLVFRNAIIVLGGASALGLLVGWWCGRIADATYWSLMIATAAYLSVASDRAYGPGFHFAWAAVGAACGATSGAIATARAFLRISVAGLVGGGVMMVFAWIVLGGWNMRFDLVTAPIIGALVAVLVQLILWVESKSRSPRYVTASWLLLAVIAGNLLVPIVLS